MNRRNFIWALSISSAGIFIPMYGCEEKLTDTEVLAIPVSMLNVSSANTLEYLGELYMKSAPDESNYDVLISLLGSENFEGVGKKVKGIKAIQKMLKWKIRNDFENNNTVILDGWILSRTEARQCALFSLIS